MSKYIRTEDKIIDVSYLNKDDKGNYYIWESDDFCANRKYIYKEDIIKESDNLEDLCDEFILFDDENKIHYQSQESSIWWLGASLYPKSVRGAIFTDKGIIYVAKMNENKELELI